MGKTLTTHFTQEQDEFLSIVRKYPQILDMFYLTGGTALSACYFNHRLSEDIDLFTRQLFRQESIVSMMKDIAKQMKATAHFTIVDTSLRYDLSLPDKRKLKVDFVHYEFDQLKKSYNLDDLAIDSLEDIAVNKLLTISQRTASKDYVDLYFILQQFTFWDLRLGVEHKFGMEIESLYLASLLKNVDLLTDMPIMKKKLSLETLKTFFLAETKKLALPMTKP